MTYLVTGGLGFIGSHLVDHLLARGAKVVVLDRSEDTKNIKNRLLNPKLRIVHKDIRDDLTLLFAQNYIAVFHLAAISSIGYSSEHPEESESINSEGTLNLLEHYAASKPRRNDKRFIFASSAAVYGDSPDIPHVETKTSPSSLYGKQKLFGEEACSLFFKNKGIRTISLRFFNVYGARQNPAGDYASLIPKFISMINKGESPTINGDGNQTRDFVHVEDIVNALVSVSYISSPGCFGQSFNIGSGVETSVNDITSKLIEISGKEIRPINRDAVCEVRRSVANISKAYNILRWEPLVTLEEGLRMTYSFFARKL